MTKFSLRLKQLREEKRLTQKELGHFFRLGISTISMYERGEREPSLDIIEKLASFFEVSTDYLIGVSDDRNPISDIKQTNENESLFFYDMDNITPEEAQALKEHLEFLRWKAKQVNNNEEKK